MRPAIASPRPLCPGLVCVTMMSPKVIAKRQRMKPIHSGIHPSKPHTSDATGEPRRSLLRLHRHRVRLHRVLRRRHHVLRLGRSRVGRRLHRRSVRHRRRRVLRGGGDHGTRRRWGVRCHRRWRVGREHGRAESVGGVAHGHVGRGLRRRHHRRERRLPIGVDAPTERIAARRTHHARVGDDALTATTLHGSDRTPSRRARPARGRALRRAGRFPLGFRQDRGHRSVAIPQPGPCPR